MKPNDFIVVGSQQRPFRIRAVLASGKIELENGKIVPAGACRPMTRREIAAYDAALARRQDRHWRAFVRSVRDLERAFGMEPGHLLAPLAQIRGVSD
jgi:hypothetical protein